MILSTPEHQELMKNVAAKCSAHFSLIPAVTSISSEAGPHEHSENGVTDVVSKLMGKFVDSKSSEGKLVAHICLVYCCVNLDKSTCFTNLEKIEPDFTSYMTNNIPCGWLFCWNID